MPENSIFDGLISNLFSTLCILIEILLCAYAKERKSQNDFKFGTFTGHFLSDGAESMAVKGLKYSGAQPVDCQRHSCTSEATCEICQFSVFEVSIVCQDDKLKYNVTQPVDCQTKAQLHFRSHM